MTRMAPLAILLTLSTSLAAAAQRPPGQDDNGWDVYLGAGALYAPAFPGDDDYNLSAVPFFRITKGDRFFASVQEGAGYAAIDQDGFRAGPLAQIDFGRDEDGSSPFRVAGDRTTDLFGLGKIDFTVALGGFAEYDLGDFKLKVKAGQALGGHDGLTGQISFDYDTRIMGAGPPLFVTVGPNIKYGSENYAQAYYGITAAQSAGSGLTPYDAGGGITSYGIGGNILVPVARSGNAAIIVLGSYDRLTGDAADSPLVRSRGSRDQFFTGAAFARKF